MKTIRGAVGAVALAVMMVFAFSGIASAVEYPPVEPTTSVLPSNVSAADVAAAPAAVSAGTLPYTGSSSSLPLAQAGVVLLVVGGGLVLFVRRRHVAHSES